MKRYQSITSSNTTTPTAWLPVDNNIAVFNIGLRTGVTGTINYDIEGTMDDIYDSTVTPLAFQIPVAALVGATASQIAALTVPVRAIRIQQNSGTGSVVLKALQQGLI